jgi:hypothetical protein
MAIVRNSARCNLCDDVIESKHRHDFRTCKCGNLSIDGGRNYVRRVVNEPGSFTERVVFSHPLTDGEADYLAQMNVNKG